MRELCRCNAFQMWTCNCVCMNGWFICKTCVCVFAFGHRNYFKLNTHIFGVAINKLLFFQIQYFANRQYSEQQWNRKLVNSIENHFEFWSIEYFSVCNVDVWRPNWRYCHINWLKWRSTYPHTSCERAHVWFHLYFRKHTHTATPVNWNCVFAAQKKNK